MRHLPSLNAHVHTVYVTLLLPITLFSFLLLLSVYSLPRLRFSFHNELSLIIEIHRSSFRYHWFRSISTRSLWHNERRSGFEFYRKRRYSGRRNSNSQSELIRNLEEDRRTWFCRSNDNHRERKKLDSVWTLGSRVEAIIFDRISVDRKKVGRRLEDLGKGTIIIGLDEVETRYD